MNKAEEQALKFYPPLFSERNGIDPDTTRLMEERRVSFENGYVKGAYDTLDALIEWLKENVTYWMDIEPGYVDAPQEIRVIDGFYDHLRREIVLDIGTDWPAVEERAKKADKALEYMEDNPLTRDEAEKQSDTLNEMANGR